MLERCCRAAQVDNSALQTMLRVFTGQWCIAILVLSFLTKMLDQIVILFGTVCGYQSLAVVL